MRKKLAQLLAGALTLSLLLSACGAQAGAPSPDPADTPSPSAAVEPASTPEPKETVSAEAAATSPIKGEAFPSVSPQHWRNIPKVSRPPSSILA